MPEEIEVPTEHLHEAMEEGVEESKEKWILGVALSSALLAGFAAVAALSAGHNANEAMLDQIKASDSWNYYQAKGIKAAILGSKMELLKTLRHAPSADDTAKLAQYKDEQDKISDEAKEDQESSENHLKHHENLAFSVTFFQVAIAVGAISALARRRAFWFVSLGFGVIGLIFLSMGFWG
jgi:hypothetical protein